MSGFYKIIFVFTLLTLFSCKVSKNEDSSAKDRNVLFIMIDDLNTTLGCYGHPLVKTPNVDRLAEMGMRYNGAYCNYAVCGPSRGSLLTGLRPTTIGILDNRTPLQDVIGDVVSLPYLFKKNGFQTIGLGKIFHGHEHGHGDAKAWDEYYDYETTEVGRKGELRNITNGVLNWCHWQSAEGTDDDQQDGRITKKAVELIKTKRDKPFFIAVGLHKPHDPFIAPKKYFDMYPLEDCIPAVLPEDWKPVYPHSLPGETKTFNQFNDTDKREFLRSYYACTSFMDAQVGRLLHALEVSGKLDNTLIVFFGDHGYHLGEHNWWNKVTVYEKGTNAPFIMAGNAVKRKGVETNAMFEFIDIYPTMAEIMGLQAPEHLEGASFAKILSEPKDVFREYVTALTMRGKMRGTMVKNKDWRYIEWAGGEKGIELYDQHKDPIEYQNLADKAEYKGVIKEMKSLLNK